MNTKLIIEAKSDFEIMFSKMMEKNACGKTMETVKKNIETPSLQQLEKETAV